MASGRLLARNSLLNLGAGGCLLILNVLFVPAMLQSFGLELYGVLSVTWMVLGHLRWLDLGFSAACAKYVAQDLALDRPMRAARWAWTAVAVQAILGVVAAALLWWAAPALASVLKVDPARREMVVFALRMFALVVPVDLASRSLNAVLEATQRFEWVNGLTLLGAAWTYLTYTAGIVAGGDFPLVVYGLVALRGVTLLATLWLASRALATLRHGSSFRLKRLLSGRQVREMFRFGGWVSVSTGIGPLLFFFDRWVISTLQGVAVLPLYAVPLQMLVSLQMIPASVTATLFPAFSVLEANLQWDRVQALVVRSHRYLLIGLIPILTILFLWAPEILRVWIDAEFAAQATLPFRILTIGFAVGLFAPFSGVLLQGAGRPDVLSRIYLIELPFNIVITVLLVRSYGIVGAAITYTLRTIVETAVLWVCVHRVFPLSWRALVRGTFHKMTPVAIGVAALALAFPGAHAESVQALAMTGVAVVAYLLVVQFHLLDAADRTFLHSVLRRARGGVSDGRAVG